MSTNGIGDASNALVGLRDDAGKEVPDVDQFLPLEGGHLDARVARARCETPGVVEQHLGGTDLHVEVAGGP